MPHDHIGHRSWQDSALSIGTRVSESSIWAQEWDNENQEASLTDERNSRL